jgi:hypothetical protein
MRDLAERVEVGVLEFDGADPSCDTGSAIYLPEVFASALDVSKLVLEESGFSVESGVVISAKNGQQLLIVAGVYPYSLALKEASLDSRFFEPEYPLDAYSEEPWG